LDFREPQKAPGRSSPRIPPKDLCSWSGGKCPKSNVSVIKMSMFWETFQNLDFREPQKAPGRSTQHFSLCGAAKRSPKLRMYVCKISFSAHGAAKSPFTYLLTYSLFDFSGKRVPKSMQLKRVSSAFRRLAWRKTPYLLTYLSTFPENVKNAFRPPARRVSKTFPRMVRGFWPLHPYLLLEVTKISGVVWATFRRVVRRKADFRCFFCFFDAQIDRYVRKYWIFDRILRGFFPLPPYLLFEVTTF